MATFQNVPLLPRLPDCPRGYHWVESQTLGCISSTSLSGTLYIAQYKSQKKVWGAVEQVFVIEAKNNDPTYLAIRYADKKKNKAQGDIQIAWQEFTTNKIALASLSAGPVKNTREWKCFLCCR